MFARLMPQEGRFFDLFTRHASEIVQGGRELVAMMSGDGDIGQRAHNIETIEKRGDKIVRETLILLHKTFITPLDRNEIHALITQMDNILDLSEDVAHAMFLYDVREPTPEARRLADLCLACAEKVNAAVALLSSAEHASTIMSLCEEVDKLEAEADHVMRAAMARLFREEPDVLRVIKLKELYEMLEGVTDRCEDVANVLESIVLERA
jgi:predicted phosphate transport protein (TIGR00153 family)